jgi:hypothetical protein
MADDSTDPVLLLDSAGRVIQRAARLALAGQAVTSPAGTGQNFLRDDGQWAVPPASGGTLTGYAAPAVVGLTQAGGTVTVSAAAGNDFRLTLTASGWVIANPANPADGQQIIFGLTQGTGGGYTVTWGTAYDFGSGSAPTLSTTAGKLDVIGFKYYASISKWVFLGSGLGN